MPLLIIWIFSIMATLIIADQKRLSVVGYFFLSIFTGPLAVVIVSLTRKKEAMNDPAYVREELNQLTSSFSMLQQKVNRLEAVINKLTGQETAPAPMIQREEPPVTKIEKIDVIEERMVPLGTERREAAESPQKSSDMELDFGRNWLNKIGIVVFTLGMGFLISYTFKYFGPFFKIAFGYLISAIFFFVGFKLEAKEKFVNFSRALLGGAWALVYFTTYAMHHFEASRLIQSPVADLVLLTMVVIGMMAHVLRYKSEGMMSMALFVAYVTSTFGHINSFTILSNLLLAVLVLFLVYKFQWVKTFILAIILTYGIHYIWVMPNLLASPPQNTLFGIATSDYHVFMNLIFLTSYGLVFFIGIHIAKTGKDSQFLNTIAAINFGNIALYNVLAYPLVLKLFYDQRFVLVFGVGIMYLIAALVMKRLGREKLYMSDIVAAVFAITFSIPLKFFPFLLFIGTSFKEKIFRFLSYALAVFVVLRLTFFGEVMADIQFLGIIWTWREFMSLWAGISMAICFYVIQRLKPEIKIDSLDEIFEQIFPAASCLYFTFLIISLIRQPWLTFALSIEGMILFAVSLLLASRRFRIYAYLVLAISAGIFVLENVYPSSIFLKWFIIGTDVLVFFAVYLAMKYLNQIKQIELIFDKEEILAFWAGVILLAFTVFQYIHPQWISLALGVAGVLLILAGILDKNKTERLGGLMLFALTLGRVALVDLAGLDMIFKIITFIALGLLFLGVSFIYNRFEQEKK